MPIRELRPIKESTADYERIQAVILKVFRDRLFLPIMRDLRAKPSELQNAADDDRAELAEALRAGRVTYARGRFRGEFSAKISRALRAAGAKWDASAKGYRLSSAALPPELRQAIAVTEAAFQSALDKVDERLRKVFPENIADDVKVSTLLDKLLWKTDKDIDSTLKGITVKAELTPERVKRIADEWQNNVQLEIKKFAAHEVQNLRERIKANVFAGNRYEGVIEEIQKSYGVTYRKAKFLARQETSLLVSKFKETRYQEAGVDEYKWGCVAGSAAHPVRPSHEILRGTIQRFSAPPVTTAAGEPARRNNPGEDYGCRCFAIPIVRF